MSRIGILNCSNATQDLGCSCSACLADLRKRRGSFSSYEVSDPIDLVGIINCPGCPTLTGSEKLLERVRGLTAFRVDVIHLSNCIAAFCPFKMKYKQAIQEAYPDIRVVEGTHQEHITREEFRQRISRLLAQPRKTMTDVILGRDE